MLLALILSVVLTPIIIKFAIKFKIYDNPGDLKTHVNPIPYMGGISIYLSTIWFMDLKLIILSTILMITGFLDDLHNLSPKLRLFIELFVMSVFVFLNPFSNIFINLFMIIFGVVVINGVNMLDGMDGLCSGILAISFFFYNFYTNDFNIYLFFALIGFLIYNFKPAKIFLGDSGSYYLGFLIFVNIYNMSFNYKFGGFVFSLLITGIIFIDFTWAVIRRLINKKGIFSGDRDHIYDKLNFKLNSVKLTVLILYLISIIYGLISIFMWDFPYFGVIISVIMFFLIGILLKMYKNKL